ncbi:MAG: ABC transporter ATP-binding protein [Dehalococcoidia bacterium]|nr:ABC transporter ATP-binding protein [Dehalococcoidia bacterium]
MLVILRIMGIVWRHKGRLILAYVSLLGATALAMFIVRLVGVAVGIVDEHGAGAIASVDRNEVLFSFPGGLFWVAALLGLVSITRGLFDFCRTYTSDSLAQMVSYDVRNRFYDKLQNVSFAFHDKEHTGNLMSKATSDIETVRRFVMMGMVRAPEVAIRLIAIVCILLIMDWRLALISLSLTPLLVVRSSVVMRRMRRMWARVQEATGQLVTILQENLTGIHVVKAFAAEEHEKKKYAAKAREVQYEFLQSEQLQGTESAKMSVGFTIALGLLLWFGGRQVIGGTMDAAEFTQFVLYLNLLTFPIRMTPFIINVYSRASASGRRLFDVLDAVSPVSEKPDAMKVDRVSGEVVFDDVSFSYDHGAPALSHLNLKVEPNSVVALLGSPGSGKSTIVSLIPRFYDATAGTISVGGMDVRDFTLASLRRNVGIVQQDVHLFTATIRDNIAYGNTEASFEEVVEAAKIAQLHDHIVDLPDGYDTWVGERGVTLSGGQRQRLSIARTILMDPPVLILDDSTSSVDVETEMKIHKAMVEVTAGRTTFVIAHRLSTVRRADLILVLQDGKVAEMGSHDELMGRGGLYREIYELQLRPQEEMLLDAPRQPGMGAVTG